MTGENWQREELRRSGEPSEDDPSSPADGTEQPSGVAHDRPRPRGRDAAPRQTADPRGAAPRDAANPAGAPARGWNGGEAQFGRDPRAAAPRESTPDPRTGDPRTPDPRTGGPQFSADPRADPSAGAAAAPSAADPRTAVPPPADPRHPDPRAGGPRTTAPRTTGPRTGARPGGADGEGGARPGPRAQRPAADAPVPPEYAMPLGVALPPASASAPASAEPTAPPAEPSPTEQASAPPAAGPTASPVEPGPAAPESPTAASPTGNAPPAGGTAAEEAQGRLRATRTPHPAPPADPAPRTPASPPPAEDESSAPPALSAPRTDAPAPRPDATMTLRRADIPDAPAAPARPANPGRARLGDPAATPPARVPALPPIPGSPAAAEPPPSAPLVEAAPAAVEPARPAVRDDDADDAQPSRATLAIRLPAALRRVLKVAPAPTEPPQRPADAPPTGRLGPPRRSPLTPLNSPQMVHRPARTVPPLAEPGRRGIEAPPNLPEGDTMSPLAAMLPMVGVMGSMVMMTVMRSSRFAIIGVFVLVAAVVGATAMFFSQRGKARRRRRVQRERYLEYLEDLREELAEEDERRRATARAAHPPPAALVDLVADQARLWERRRRDPDFLHLRLGAGPVPQRVLEIDHSQSNAITPVDPFMRNEAGELRERFGTTPDMPLTVPLDRVGNVSVVGTRRDTLRVLRALLTQAAVSHAPDDLGLALCTPADSLGHYEWAKWLPHALDPEATDAAGPARRIATDPGELATVIAAELRTRAARVTEIRRGLGNKAALDNISRLLIVLDTPDGPATELPRTDETVSLVELGVTVLHPVTRRVDEPGDVSVRILVDGDRITIEDLRQPTPLRLHGTLDDCPPQQSESLARLLAPLRLSPESDSGDTPLSAPVSFPELLGIEDPAALDATRLWAPRGERDFLRVPIGVGDLHEPVMLDIKESAELGMGPHGLCVGATGSGKSELLRTLLLALVATHAPEDLAVVLVDYKGGATFAPFESLPHVAGVITNLESVPGLVERVHASLAGEVKRRQQVLKDAGHFANVGDYNAARRSSRPDLDPLPHLFVVIDEFGELLTAKPDFIDLFLSIGRIGRSIGVHLLLSSQRIEAGKLRGLETYLSYRLGLRTFSAEESRTVLDSKDAFELPPVPGFGYLKVDTSVYERFKAAYVSGAHQGPARRAPAEAAAPTVTVFPARNLPAAPAAERDPDARPAPPERDTKDAPTLLSTVVDALSTAADPVRQIWLPPLPDATTLDRVGGGTTTTPDGLRLGGAPLGPLRVPVGLLDDPGEQWQGQWVLDLTVAGGHQAVIGGPQSGKTTLLRTLVLSLALTHSPRDVAVYGLDLVGGGLRPLEGLPHVGGIATRTDRERVTRTVDELRTMLAERELLFRDHAIDSVDSLRRARAAGRLPALGSTEIVLVIDGYGAIREEFDHLDGPIGDLLRRGGGYGIHVVAGMLRWNDVRINAQSSFGSRLELRLNDPHDSGIDRKLMETVPTGTPGRALTDAQLFGHVALPRIDGTTDEENAAGLEEAVRRVRDAWTGEPVRAVRVLPPRLPASSLPAFDGGRTIPIAVREDLTTVGLDLEGGGDQHLVVLGDSECGKTNLLRLVADGLMERYSDEELVFAVLDPRRGLRTAVPERYRGGYAHNADLAGRLAAGIAGKLQERMPDSDLAPEAMEPGTFTGPRIVVLIDDYDVLATANQRPLQPFLPFIPSAPDIGLHFVVARRMAGISRGFFEPFLQSLKENGSTTLLMTGDRQEGQVFPKLYPSALPPGRGVLVRRGAPYQLVQTAVR